MDQPTPARPATHPAAGPPPRFSVVVPCYNEEDGIADTVAELRRHLGDPAGYELVIVDDGSRDGTADALAALRRDDAHLRVETHPVNRGYGAALKTGIRRAKSHTIVITDADGTYPNHRIPELVVDVADGEADMVVGARVADDVEYPLIRKIPKAFLIRFASWLARTRIPDMNSGLRVMRREVVLKYVKILPDSFSFTTTITLAMLQNYHDVRWVPIGYKARVGKSKIKPVRDTLRFLQLIGRTGMYFAPLRLLLPVVGVLLLVTIGFGVYDVSRGDLGDKTVLLLMFTMNTAIFALLADMIDKRSAS